MRYAWLIGLMVLVTDFSPVLAVECASASVKAPEKTISVSLSLFSIGRFFRLASKASRMEEALADAQQAQNDFETYLTAKPEPSPDLDIKYSKTRNLKVFATRLTLDLFHGFQDVEKNKTFEWDRVFSPKVFELDLDNPCDTLAQKLTVEEKSSLRSIRDRNRGELTTELEDLKGKYVGLVEGPVILDEGEYEGKVSEIQNVLKTLIESRYKEIFQVRRVLDPAKMKEYLTYVNERKKLHSLHKIF